MDDTLALMKELTEAPGPSGFEDEVRQVTIAHLKKLADDLTGDRLGSVIATKVGKKDGPRVMLAGHMDEVGFIVKHITDEGYVKLQTVGGWWSQVMPAQRLAIQTGQGEVLGVVGMPAPHVLDEEKRKSPFPMKDMALDIGASSLEEAASFGVRIGDPVVPVSAFTVLKNPRRVMGKAWDDRFGVAAIIEIFKALQGKKHPNVLIGAATVQEEVGLRGAQTAANMMQPDIGFALDVSISGDSPGMEKNLARGVLGKGPSIFVYDGSMIPSRRLRDFVFDIAAEENIPFQLDSLPYGGTDAGVIHKVAEGTPSLVIGQPTRYVHSHAAVWDRDDFAAAVKLMVAVIHKLDQKTVDYISFRD